MTQDTALTIMKTGANVFLTGEPGSGKTHTVNAYIHYLREHGVDPSITASTGIAATHVGGMTIHSWSGIGIKRALSEQDLDTLSANEALVKRMSLAKVLVIDEISMLDGTIFNMVEIVTRTLRRKEEPFGGLQVICVGDFFQLPPIADKESGARPQFCFESSAWRLANPIVCYLSEQHRQDDTAFLSTLGAIRRGELEDHVFEYLGERGVAPGDHPADIPQLFTHNVDVDTRNKAELAKIDAEERIFLMQSKGKEARIEQLVRGCLSPQELVLKEGASVMFTKNSFDAGYVNGTLGTIVGFDADSGYPVVETQKGDTITAVPSEWAVDDGGKVLASIEQIPLRLAWAITVHKSQGMSLDAATMDLSRAFEYGQGYVALSRVRTFSGLYILGINQRAFEVHPLVLERDRTFRERSEHAEQGFLDMEQSIIHEMHQQFLRTIGARLEAQPLPKERPKLGDRTPTTEETRKLVFEGKTLDDIATLRDMTVATIVGHVEQLVDEGKISSDVVRTLSGLNDDEMTKIADAFAREEDTRLKPVFEALDEVFTYPELRLARLALRLVRTSLSDPSPVPTQDAPPPSVQPVRPEKLGAKWTEDEEATLVRMVQSNTPVKDIALTLKRQPGGIRSRMRKLGLA
jgi:ATP-dependent DNA helicase PIF1